MAENVAKVTLEVGTDTSKVAGQVAAAKAQVEAGGVGAAADKVTAAQQKQIDQLSVIGSKLKDIKKTYGEQIEVVQGLIGKFSAVVGVATLAYQLGVKTREVYDTMFENGIERAKDFMSSLSSMDASVRLDGVRKEIAATEQELAKMLEAQDYTETFLGPLAAQLGQQNLERIKEKLAELRKQEGIIRDFVEQFGKGTPQEKAEAAEVEAKAAAAKEAEVRKRAIDELANAEREAKRELMTDEEKIRADANDRIAKIEEARAKLTPRERIETVRQATRTIANINEKARRDIAEIQNKQGKDLREHYEEQSQAAERVRTSWTNAYRAIREESNRAFATDQAASMVQLAAQMRLEGTVAAANMNQIIVQGVG